MKALKKTFATLSSIVLAFALMVPTIALADGEETNEENKLVDLDVRVAYANTDITIADLESVPHSISITFKPQVTYAAFADKVTYSFTLNNSEAMKKLRVAHSTNNADGSYTVTLSNGNDAIPMTNGLHLDLGTLNIKIDDNFNPAANDALSMLAANIQVTSLSTSDDSFQATNSITSEAPVDVNFNLVPASTFASVDNQIPSGSFNYQWPVKSVPSEVTVWDDQIYMVLVTVAGSVLNDIWDNTSLSPANVYDNDLAGLRSFVERAQNANLEKSDISVTPSLTVTKYGSVADVPVDQVNLLGKDDTLGFYDISISIELDASSISTRTTVGLKNTNGNNLGFTFSYPEVSFSGKTVTVGYVHENEAKSINDVDVANNAVTFSTNEFSTYGIFASSTGTPSYGPGSGAQSGSDAQRNTGSAGAGLATTGDTLTIAALLIGVAILAGAGAGIVIWRKRRAS